MTRRTALSALAAGLGVGGLAASTGCVGSSNASRASPGGDSVSVLAAGSLARVFDERLRPLAGDGVDLDLEFHGSAACARLVREGLRDPDVLVLADPALFEGIAERYTAVATNELVVAHAGDTVGGRAVARAEFPLDPVLERELRWGRTDPDADPLGYRTLFALRLAERARGRPYPEALASSRLFPEAELLAVFEAGALDAAVVYRNMALDHGVSHRVLPASVNLGSPARAEAYARETYELPDGTVVRGSPIRYGAVARRESAAVAAVFDAVVAGAWTGDAFGTPPSYPRVESVGSPGSDTPA
ncbi:substrate-binding domain-containing protein [Halobaculum gomorrense]|uniref:substrate-binding domain-containing protein n=1 Tax=Halobaculum gomorrense TaxID=43928 RepID=UPI0013565624|nr:substrate-binding domain-containing protein [Halobaculum gomorrense]